MVSEPGLVRGLGFEPPCCNLFPIDLKVHGGLYLVCLTPRVGMRLDVREGVEGMIFILNPYPTSLNF